MAQQGQLLQALLVLERDLRRLIADAATAGDFEAVSDLTLIAKGIPGIVVQWRHRADAQHRERSVAVATDVAHSTHVDSVITRDETTSPQKRAEYPQFLREKDELVKLGWSPREEGSYEHRVPRKTVDVIARAIILKG